MALNVNNAVKVSTISVSHMVKGGGRRDGRSIGGESRYDCITMNIEMSDSTLELNSTRH